MIRLRFDRWSLRLVVVTSTRNQQSGCFKNKQVKTWSHLHCFCPNLVGQLYCFCCCVYCFVFLLSLPLCFTCPIVCVSELFTLHCPISFFPSHKQDMILWVSQDSVHLFNQQNSGIYVNAYIHNNYIPLTTIRGNY